MHCVVPTVLFYTFVFITVRARLSKGSIVELPKTAINTYFQQNDYRISYNLLVIYVHTSTDIMFKNYYNPSAISVEDFDLLEAFTNVNIDTKRLMQEFIFKVEAADKQEIDSSLPL